MKTKDSKDVPEAVIARQRKQIETLKKELGDLKEAYFRLVDRLELIEDLHPQVIDALREQGLLNDDAP